MDTSEWFQKFTYHPKRHPRPWSITRHPSRFSRDPDYVILDADNKFVAETCDLEVAQAIVIGLPGDAMLDQAPSLKFKLARVSLDEAATLLYTNHGDDRWGHVVLCSPFDYFRTPRPGPETAFAILPAVDMHALKVSNPTDPIYSHRFRPDDRVPEGEVQMDRPRARS
jgi:hypothetical protein